MGSWYGAAIAPLVGPVYRLRAGPLAEIFGNVQTAAEEGAVKTPSYLLKSINGQPVIVKLDSGIDYIQGCPAPLLRAGAQCCHSSHRVSIAFAMYCY